MGELAMKRNLLAKNNAFSLVELLVALAMASLVGIAAVTVFTATNRTTTAQVDLTQSQQSVRASMDRLSQHVRAAGFGLPDRGSFTLTFGANTFTRPVSVTNSNAGPDSLTLVGIGYEIGALNPYQANGCNESGKSCLSLSSTETASRLRNARYISVAGASYQTVALGGVAVTPDNESDSVKNVIFTLSSAMENLPQNFFGISPPPSVFILQALQYTIVANTTLTGCSALQPCLVVQDFSGVTGGGNRQVLAQGIEDLQIGIYETPASGGPANFSSGATTASPRISALRLNLVGKSATEDQGMIFQLPALEDRPLGANDKFRRRALTKVVKIRNPRPGS